MPKFDTGRPDLKLDLSPPNRLDLWAIALSCGIVAGTIAPPFTWALAVASVSLAVGALLWRNFVPQEWRIMAISAPLFVAGGLAVAFLHLTAPDPLAELAALEPGEVIVAGKVSSPPVPGGYGYRSDVRVEHLWYEDREVLRGGKIQVFSGDLSVGVGDEVRVDGEITRPQTGEDGFDYARYLSTKGISAVVYAEGVRRIDEDLGWIGQVHRRTDAALSYGLRPTEASIVRAMVLGDRSRMPEELEEDFRRSGITHILAISGQHVAILAAMAYFVLRYFAVPLPVRVSVTLTLVWLYILIAGAPPSATRAGVVATLVLGASLLGRQVSPLHFMTAMLAFVLAYNPDLVYSTGFQLSVAAVFGILLLRKPIKAFCRKRFAAAFRKGAGVVIEPRVGLVAGGPDSHGPDHSLHFRRSVGYRHPDEPGGGAAFGTHIDPGAGGFRGGQLAVRPRLPDKLRQRISGNGRGRHGAGRFQLALCRGRDAGNYAAARRALLFGLRSRGGGGTASASKEVVFLGRNNDPVDGGLAGPRRPHERVEYVLWLFTFCSAKTKNAKNGV